jgi:protein-tyrosine phosphatase
MSAFVIDLKNADDLRDVVHRAVAALASGQIVAVPTETVYGLAASALDPRAVVRLSEIKGRDPTKPFAFAIKSYEDALDYVPDLSPLGRRIARRCWPGPLTLVVDNDHRDSVVQRLPDEVRKVTIPNGTIGLRVPANEVVLQILRLLAGPIVLTSANYSEQEPAINGKQVVEALGSEIDLVLDDGPCRFGQASSVVKVDSDGVKFLRVGVIDEKTLKRMTGFIALVVCTGNTCRSPMGEALLKKRFAEKLGCQIEELDDLGVTILSAGIAAMPGGRPSPQAIEVMQKFGIDISQHRSQPISHRLTQFADVILAMTKGHQDAIVTQWPDVASRTRTLSRNGADISDPIGMPIEIYEATARQIDENLAEWIKEFQLTIPGKNLDSLPPG